MGAAFGVEIICIMVFVDVLVFYAVVVLERSWGKELPDPIAIAIISCTWLWEVRAAFLFSRLRWVWCALEVLWN